NAGTVGTSKFDLTLNAVETGNSLYIHFEYSTKLFKEETIKRYINYFKGIVHTISVEPGQKISEIEIITEEEKKKLLYEFNDTAAEYPRDKTIHQLFEEQALRAPDSTALVGSGQLAVGKKKIKENKKTINKKETIKDKKLTTGENTSSIQHPVSSIQSIQLSYRELNEKSNRLARLLQSKGVAPGTIVAIIMERSIEMIIGIMGILKAGGAYLPIDPQSPRKRTKYILKDSNAKKVLKEIDESGEPGEIIELQELDELEELGEGIEIIDINTINQTFTSTETQQPVPRINHPASNTHPESGIQHPASGLAYIIYTSGSTGQPKGVLISHRNVMAYLGGSMKRLNLTAKDIRTQTSAVTFDHFVEEVYHILFAGGKLLIVTREDSRDIIQQVKQIKRHQVTVMSTTPAMLKLLSEYSLPGGLRQLITGGDVLKREDIAGIAGKIPIYNYYGPTEATVSATHYPCPAPGKIPEAALTVPIGRPMTNYKIYILDRYDNIVPRGVEGEICIAGDAVAAGYLNKPELTAERFVKHKLQTTNQKKKTIKDKKKATRETTPRPQP
ncbi:MAG: amino acid adenylation domain-containing protein, partial [bacterium]|nr:amino acid adenylation domain-containing protein [bacterium]